MFSSRVKLNRFEPEILAYEQQPIETGKIIFYGSSIFTRWSERWNNIPLEQMITGKNGEQVALNHGVGGSTVEELLYYYPRLIKPYRPRALFITSFLNDQASGYSPAEIMFLLGRLLDYARCDMPGIRIYVADVHPITLHLGRRGSWEAYLNNMRELLADYCARHDDCKLITHWDDPIFYNSLEDVGDIDKIRQDIFIEDKVHLTPEGYELYAQFIRKNIADIL